MTHRLQSSMLAGLALATLLAAPVAAAPVADRAGDFLPTYTGARTGDLDVIRTDVTFTGSSFVFDATLNARVGTTPSAFYVWGVDRGQGTPRFGTIAGPGSASYDSGGVLFDSVVIVRPGGASAVNDLSVNPLVATALSASSITVSGAEIRAIVPAELLPSRGLSFDAYRFNLWPRDAATAGSNQIADFAPDNSTSRVSTVPEPAPLALLAFAGVLALVRRRRAG